MLLRRQVVLVLDVVLRAGPAEELLGLQLHGRELGGLALVLVRRVGLRCAPAGLRLRRAPGRAALGERDGRLRAGEGREVVDQADRLPHPQPAARRHEDAHDAGLRRLVGHRRLVGLDLRDLLALRHGLAVADQPRDDRALLHGVGEPGHDKFHGHGPGPYPADSP